MRRLAAIAIIGSVVLVPVGAAAQEEPAPPACPGLAAGTEVGVIGDPDVLELSGIAASRTHPGVLWVHNDSGGEPELQALSSTGEPLGHHRIEGAEANDWEDIGIGPGPEPGRTYLYVADIGDNGSTRQQVTVYVVPEPDAAPDGDDGVLPVVAELTITYPDGPSDAEALFVDPVDGGLTILTKDLDGPSRVLQAPAAVVVGDEAEVTLEDAGGFQPGGPVTAADISPDGSTVLVRTYGKVFAYRRPAGQPLAAAFASPPCTAPSVNEPQGEAIAFAADGASYLTASEGASQPIHRFAVDPPLAPTTTAAPSTTAPVDDDGGSDGGGTSAVPIIVAAAIGAAVVALIVLAVVTRRRTAVVSERRSGDYRPAPPGQ